MKKKQTTNYHALSLISGGLDSLIATKLIMDQGIHVTGINFFTGFTGDHDYILKKNCNGDYSARNVAKQLGIEIHIINVVKEFKDILFHPVHGYGKNFNPCLDCKLFMILQSKRWLDLNKLDFIVTGEVFDQRPMSQNKNVLPLAVKLTDDLVVRPLSAKLLPETLPEKQGWINRSLLQSISGRSRQYQIALAKKFGFTNWAQPAGGCLLTDSSFCYRFKDFSKYNNEKIYDEKNILLLRIGRHLRISSSIKIVIGRNEIENNFLKLHFYDKLLLQCINYPGAVILVDNIINNNIDDIHLSFIAKIAGYFSKGRNEDIVNILIEQGSFKKILKIEPLRNETILTKLYLKI